MNISNKEKVIQDHPEIKFKLEIIEFFNEFGLRPTIKAFKRSRSTIFLWKKKYKEKDIYGLINQSKRPYNTRRMLVDTKLFEYIKDLRIQYPRLGKEKIKILLDKYCKENKLKSLSESKIGRLIKKHNWYLYLGVRNTNKQVIRDKKRVFGYSVDSPGDLFQIDTIVRFEHGIKRYIVTAIDVKSKFTFAYTYKNHSSKTAADFASKLIKVTPYPIRAIQTDNGSEFLKHFDKTIHDNGTVHFFTYPRCPKQNGVIERFNRTIQDDFVETHREYLELNDTKQFNNLLIDYLLFYNTQRPHKTLNNKVPMEVVTNYLKESNMWWTDTNY